MRIFHRKNRTHFKTKHEHYDLVADSGLFEAEWYKKSYPDVAQSKLDPLDHFLDHGLAERRDPNPFFSTTFYVEQHPDLRGSKANPLVHFITQGAAERRNPSEFFDCDWYLNMYRDVAGSGMNPLLHYRKHGESEGRCPNAAFSPIYYRAKHLGDAPASLSPLEHYILTGRRQGLDAKQDEAERYRLMTDAQEDHWRRQRTEIEAHIALMTSAPHFFVYAEGDDDEEGLGLRAQIYTSWTLCRDKDELLRAASRQTGAWSLVWMSAGDACHAAMLYCFACEHERDQNVEVVYADDDVLAKDGSRSRPFYKPAWSPDYLECCNYIGSAACVNGRLARQLLSESRSQYDFLLRATEVARQIIHLPTILGHRRHAFDSPRSVLQQQEDMLAISMALDRASRPGTVAPAKAGFACYTIAPKISSCAPPISVVIPTAGQDARINGRDVDLVCNLVERIRGAAAYRDLEIIAVVNEDLSDIKLRALHERDVRTIVYRSSDVNIARKINLGASIAERDYLLLLNDDIEPLTEDWIERMLAHFRKPHVGVVGAKLLYGDRRVQHVGVVLNSGNPDHPRSRYPDDDPGYYFSSLAARNFLAVTGAVMLTPRAIFEAVGGFTIDLAISYNDIDYCLKVRELDKGSIYCPDAKLFHYESLSRKRVLDMSEAVYFHKRWGCIVKDPYYNEEFLTMAPPTYEPCNNGKLIG